MTTQKSKVLLIQGLPGSGKTTLALKIKQKLNAIHFNADWARATITSHLRFTEKDRVAQARALGQLAAMVHSQGQWVIVDFVCPLTSTRAAFFEQFKERDDVYSVWMDTIKESRFDDTNKMYMPPGLAYVDHQIGGYYDPAGFDALADSIVASLTKGHRTYHLRYNTHSNGVSKQWRIIDSETGVEQLVDHFDLRGHMVPSSTVEHEVRKFNVNATGYPCFYTDENGCPAFSLTYHRGS